LFSHTHALIISHGPLYTLHYTSFFNINYFFLIWAAHAMHLCIFSNCHASPYYTFYKERKYHQNPSLSTSIITSIRIPPLSLLKTILVYSYSIAIHIHIRILKRHYNYEFLVREATVIGVQIHNMH
jgi:hypothetical protein